MATTENNIHITCKPWQILLWPLHSTTSSFFYILTMFMGYIATGGYGIAVATAGMIATGTRLFDGIVDPFVAMFTDRIQSKFGRVRILIVLGRGIQALSCFAMYYWGLGGGAVVYTLIYMVYIVGGTISSIATHTGNPVLTNDPKQRPKIFRWQMIYSTTIGAAFQIFLSKVLVPRHGGLNVELFQEICIWVVVLSAVFELLACTAITPSDKPENFPKKKNKKNVNLLDTWHLLKDNRAMQMYIISGVSDKVASNAASQAAITTLIYGVIIANYGFSGTVSGYSMIPNILFLLFGTQLMTKSGTKKSLVTWTAITTVLCGVMVAFMALTDPTAISVSPLPTAIFIGLMLLYGASRNMTSAATNAVVPDIVDYEFYRSGNFIPGAVGTLYSFVDEMTSSLSTTIVGFCLAAVGYVTVQPQPGDPCTTAIFWMAMFLWMGLPILGYLCTLVAMKWYPLDRETMEKVQMANKAAREEAKAAKS